MESGGLTGKLNKLKDDIANSEARLTECQEEIKIATNENNRLSDEIDDLSRKIKVKMIELNRRKSALNNVKEKTNNITQEKARLAEISMGVSLDITIEELTENIRSLRVDKDEVERVSQELSNRKKNAENNLKRSEDKLKRLNDSISTIQKKVDNVGGKLDTYADDDAGINEDEMYDTVKQLEATLLEETVKTENSDRSFTHINNQRSTLKKSLDHYKLELSKVDQELNAINDLI